MVSMATLNVLLKNLGVHDTRYKNLYLTSDTFKQITLAIKATIRQTCYKANILYYPMFRYANYQICIFINFNENIRNKRNS